MKTRLARWRLSLEIALWRHGVLWPLLLLCVVLTMGVWWGGVQPQKELLVELSQRAADQAQKRKTAQPAVPVKDEQAHTWQQIRQSWPPAQQVETHIATVLQAAQKRGLVVEQGDYQYRAEPELNALKVTMNLPLNGSYANLRSWVDAVLRDHPNLALDELAIKRETVSSAQAEVKVRWVGWYRADDTQLSTSQNTSQNTPQTTAPKLAPAASDALIPASSEVRQ
jgi:hypothetical protein